MGPKDTFTIPDINDHLHVVISDPGEYPDQVICFNLTTWKGDHCDPACIIDCNEHKWVKHKSYVYYANPCVLNTSVIETMSTSNRINWWEPITDLLYARILSGAIVTTSLSIDNKGLLVAQGLIDP